MDLTRSHLIKVCRRANSWDPFSLCADVSSAFEAYKAMGDHYTWWMLLPQDDFSRIVDPNDQVFTLLATNCTS